MRRQLQALACLGSLAALSIPVPATAQAATARACRVTAAKPYVDSKGMIRGTASRVGCTDTARLRVRIVQVVAGKSRAVKSGSREVTSGRLTTAVRCTTTPRRYYVIAMDYKGAPAKSPFAILSCKTATTPTTPTPTPTPTTGGDSSIEDQVVSLTNKARESQGCRPLINDPKLSAAAREHSSDMAAKNYFDHTSKDGRSPGDRIRAAGFSPISTWGENIAMGQRTPADVVKGWLNSPGHRANIMNCAFTHIGVGYAKQGPLWTQVFAAH
ncbi:CAP domain-containing protein [Nonomuraea sediminis]|uniref:CAP domain-containing protein n=1 Tax=Nonomuraea sediminis TaxID=2835864 RepID=UPI0027E09018|nr:CAP domain-containing protein [Nonomuraea sediminis]